jgi:hypothetical protein
MPDRPFRRPTRRLTLGALALLTSASAASRAGAQPVAAQFAPGCGPATACGTVRVTIGAPAGGLDLAALTLTLLSGPYRFAPVTPTGPAVGSFTALDDFGPFGGFTAIGRGGTELFVDFLDTGDPANPGLPFTLGARSSGYLAVDVTPRETTAPFHFRYAGRLADGGTIEGEVMSASVVPEPDAASLIATGLAAVGVGARRRARWRARRRAP